MLDDFIPFLLKTTAFCFHKKIGRRLSSAFAKIMLTLLEMLLFLIQIIFLIEHFNTSTSLGSLLLSCIERMAFGADFHVDILLGGTGRECIPAVAGHGSFIIVWMNSFFHCFTSFQISEKLLTLRTYSLLTALLVYHAVNRFATIHLHQFYLADHVHKLFVVPGFCKQIQDLFRGFIRS